MSDFSGKVEGEALLHAVRHISDHRNTGVLLLRNGRTLLEISFREGDVLTVETSVRAKNRRLGALMHRAGFISKDQVSYALEVQKETLQRVGRIFTDRLGFDPDLIDDFARLQKTDAFFQAVLWESGEFEFTAKEVGLAWDRTEPISSDYLMNEARQLVTDWDSIKNERPRTKDGFAQAKPLPLVDDGVLKDDHRRLFEAFDVARSFDAAVFRSRLGEYRGARAIGTLLNSGYLEPAKPQKSSLDQAWWRRAWAQLKPLQVMSAAFIYSLIIAGFVGLFMLSDLSWYGVSLQGLTRYQAKTVKNYYWSSTSKVLHRSLELYKMRHGNYPDRLRDLSKDWIISEGFLKTYDLDQLIYWSDGDEYWLSPQQALPAKSHSGSKDD